MMDQNVEYNDELQKMAAPMVTLVYLSAKVHKWNRKTFNPVVHDQVCLVSILLVMSMYEVEKFVAALKSPKTKVLLLLCTYSAKIVDQEEGGCLWMFIELLLKGI
jgi:hypothetical protein